MNIVLLRRKQGCSGLYVMDAKKLAALVVAGFLILPVGLMYAGYQLGVNNMRANPDDMNLAYQTEIDSQRLKIDEATQDARENMDALALRLGKLQAHVIRLDALGSRLTTMAKLERGEFDFSQPPAQGGPVSSMEKNGKSMEVHDFLGALGNLSSQLDNRSQQLNVLETMMMTNNLQAEVEPAGRPISRGWLSSYFGIRTDPFTGRRVHHSGIDFAGKLGSDIVAVASGVVTFAGRRSGYGNLVEVNHGKGYSTRYGHALSINVQVGDTVKKGQVVAKMGTTGRSTGPHVHFEVLNNGRAVNPKRYIFRASAK
ncbi:Peptidase, M23/M37 family [hydrothermal vent metagenome]|uniref:Peptidase, M23/M37 family n=1 Tax=hydrothermal vent metagenome TaxID=652676 RepID=A0A3B1A120_9ZZZZ